MNTADQGNPTVEFNEPERYELHEGPYYHFQINRRDFSKILGAGILISVAVPSLVAQRAREERALNLAQRLHIGVDGIVTVLTSKVEVGQGSRTQLTQAAAEELRLPISHLRLIMADTALVPDDGGTAGSRTTPSSVPAIRRGCAAARQLLLKTAAEKFRQELEDLSVKDGRVLGLGDGKQFGYADLAKDHADALKNEVASGVNLAGVSEWRVLGTNVAKVNAEEIVTGTHRYPSDIRRPGMLYGKVLRPATYGAQLESVDLAGAEKLSGVTAVRDGDFVGFAAATSYEAEVARDAVEKNARWKNVAQPSSDELFAHLRAHVTSGRPRREIKGSPDEHLRDGPQVRRETYHVAYIQHVPMEPRAAVAEWADGNLTVWTGTQQPSRVLDDLRRAFRLNPDQVRVVVPDTGGGFGGKHSGEAAVEAARLALAAKKPVSLRWTRAEEFTWAYFRPAGVIDVAAALNVKNELIAWQHVNFNSGASALGTPYEIEHVATEFKSCDQPLRSGSYRALASTANVFARESFMDELANVAGTDPLAFRLRYLRNERLRGVLSAATDRFGWKEAWRKNTDPQKTGLGLACGMEKGSYVACCVRIELDPSTKTFKAIEICEAFECGAIQNPANLKAQVEGAIIQGLGGALTEQMRFQNGKMLNAKFSAYQVPRFKDVPRLETVLVDRRDLPSVGAGETPIVGIAPAIGNALFHATQVRLRSLPLRNAEWRAA